MIRSAARERWVCGVGLATAALAFALLRAPFLSLPLERDEGEYAYIAQRWLAGDVPYRDAFDQKPPGVFLAYAGAFLAFGQSIEAIHGFLYLWTAAAAAVLFALVRRLADPLAAALAVLVFSVTSADPVLAATAANTELFMLLPLAASVLAMERGLAGGGRGAWLACGALAAAACWFKPVAAANALFVAAFAALELPRRRAPAALAAMAAGAAALSLPLCLYLAAQGAWGPFVDAVVLHNLRYAQVLTPRQSASNLALQLRLQAPGFAVLWLLAAVALLHPRLASRRTRALLGGWALASLVGVASAVFFRPHYFVQLLPALSALAGVGAAGLLRLGLGRPSRAAAAAATVALLALLLAPPVVARWEALRAGSPQAASRRIYGMNPFPEAVEIGAYLRRRSGPDDAVFVVGSEPQILFYAARRSASRFIFFYPLADGSPLALARQRHVLREVEASQPLYVVWVNLAQSLSVHPDPELPILRATAQWLERDYRLELVAVPTPEGPDYHFARGDRARQVVRANGARWPTLPWLAVYRRGDAATDLR